MSKSGPRPRPVAVENLLGNPNKQKRKIDPAVAANLPGVGGPFDDMSDEAKDKWYEVVEAWDYVLKWSDRDFLRMYCDTWVDMMVAHRAIGTKADDMLTIGAQGIKVSPYVDIVNKHRNWLYKAIQEFGGTPSARTRMALVDPGNGKKSKFDGLMK